jgi:hypothetical protein
MCVNSPATRAKILDKIEALGRLKVDGVQFDDPATNANSFLWGGCFCPFCIQGFSRYLATRFSSAEWRALGVRSESDFDYRKFILENGSQDAAKLHGAFGEFQLESTIQFHRWWQDILDRISGHHVATSCNNTAGLFDGAYSPFDFWIGELEGPGATPAHLYQVSRNAARMGKIQILTMPLFRSGATPPDSWTGRMRATLATTYATGMLMEAPWDTFVPAPEPTRFFGNPKDSADLYAMIRACAHYLEGYEEVEASGPGLAAAHKTPPVAASADSSGTYIFVRARPGDRRAPVVVHLVCWRPEPTGAKIQIDLSLLFDGAPVEAELVTPVPYQRVQHDLASITGDYSKLISRQVLAVSANGEVSIPALHPWGIMLIKPVPLSGTGMHDGLPQN